MNRPTDKQQQNYAHYFYNKPTRHKIQQHYNNNNNNTNNNNKTDNIQLLLVGQSFRS